MSYLNCLIFDSIVVTQLPETEIPIEEDNVIVTMDRLSQKAISNADSLATRSSVGLNFSNSANEAESTVFPIMPRKTSNASGTESLASNVLGGKHTMQQTPIPEVHLGIAHSAIQRSRNNMWNPVPKLHQYSSKELQVVYHRRSGHVETYMQSPSGQSSNNTFEKDDPPISGKPETGNHSSHQAETINNSVAHDGNSANVENMKKLCPKVSEPIPVGHSSAHLTEATHHKVFSNTNTQTEDNDIIKQQGIEAMTNTPSVDLKDSFTETEDCESCNLLKDEVLLLKDEVQNLIKSNNEIRQETQNVIDNTAKLAHFQSEEKNRQLNNLLEWKKQSEVILLGLQRKLKAKEKENVDLKMQALGLQAQIDSFLNDMNRLRTSIEKPVDNPQSVSEDKVKELVQKAEEINSKHPESRDRVAKIDEQLSSMLSAYTTGEALEQGASPLDN